MKTIERFIISAVLILLAYAVCGCKEKVDDYVHQPLWSSIGRNAEKLEELENKLNQLGQTFDIYIDPNDTTDCVLHLPEGTKLVSIKDLRDYYRKKVEE